MQKELADFSIRFLEKKGVSYAEARLESHETNDFTIKNGILQVASFNKTVGLGLRFIVKDTLGFVSINKFDKNSIKNLINNAFSITEKSSKIGEKISFSPETVNKKNYKINQKIKIDNFSTEEKINYLFELEKTIKDTKVKTSGRFISLEDDITKKYYTNTEGTKISSEIPRISFFSILTIQNNTQSAQRFLHYGGTEGYELLKKWNLGYKVKEEILNLNNNLEKGKKAPKEKINVLLGHEVVGIAVHESVGHPYEADRIFGREAAQAGESFVNKSMLGLKIGSNCVTVVDDPTLKKSNGFYLYDDEGVKAKRKFLLKNGRINEFLHNRSTASELGIKSNGAARASNFDKEAIVRMSNTFMLPGDYTEDELIKDTKSGVYIKNYTEWNIDDKRYQQKYVGLVAYLIKNGEISHPVKKPALEITTPAFWSSIDAASKKIEYTAGTCGKGEPMQGIPVWFGGPIIRLKNIRLK